MTLTRFISTSLSLIIAIIIFRTFNYNSMILKSYSNLIAWMIACYSSDISIVADEEDWFLKVLYTLISMTITYFSIRLVLHLFLGKDF